MRREILIPAYGSVIFGSGQFEEDVEDDLEDTQILVKDASDLPVGIDACSRTARALLHEQLPKTTAVPFRTRA